MEIFLKALFWFLIALGWAIAEIEIEGKYGWSEKSQTWYRTGNHHPKNFFLRVIMAGKPLTGYHIPVFSLAILISHAHFFMGVPWSIPFELLALALFTSWAPLWDNLWLFFNPNYNVATLTQDVWWYKRWVLGVFPLENVTQWIASILFAFLASKIANDPGLFYTHILFLSYLFLFAAISVVFLSPVYKNWNLKMKTHDDRDKVEK